DLPVFRPASRSHESAAVPRALQIRRIGHFLSLVQPRNVIIRQFLECVERHDVIDIQLRTGAGSQSLDDPLQLLLIFRIDLRPQHFARGFPEEFPVAFGGMHHSRPYCPEPIFDFRRQQVPVLIANRAWIALEMNVDPAALFEPRCGFQSWIACRCMFPRRRNRDHHRVIRRRRSLRCAPRPPQRGSAQDHQQNRCRPPRRIRAHLASCFPAPFLRVKIIPRVRPASSVKPFTPCCWSLSNRIVIRGSFISNLSAAVASTVIGGRLPVCAEPPASSSATTFSLPSTIPSRYATSNSSLQ